MSEDVPGPPASPPGWYPDPSGLAQWRRWEGASWGSDTMPYGPVPPDPWTLGLERGSWPMLKVTAPFGLLAPALFAAALAADSVALGPLREWYRVASNDLQDHRPLPPFPVLHPASTAVSVIYYGAWFVMLFGLGAWLRYALASMRVCGAAGYPTRRHPGWTCVGLVIPLLGAWVGWLATREWLPSGHEARPVLSLGWALVAAGEVGFVALAFTTVVSSSQPLTWTVAGVTALFWAASALVLPRGLEAVADDHATLGVRRVDVAS